MPSSKTKLLSELLSKAFPKTAQDLGISESILYNWRAKRLQGGDSLENQKLHQAELIRLKRENARLQEECAFLKKVATYFTKESQ